MPEKLTRRTMFFKASVFNLPGKFTPVKVGMKNDNAVPEKLKDGSEIQMFQVSVSLPEINEVGKLFNDKKPPDEESDNQVIDVRRHRNAYLPRVLQVLNHCRY